MVLADLVQGKCVFGPFFKKQAQNGFLAFGYGSGVIYGNDIYHISSPAESFSL
jgi:hypothetical protein